MIVVVTGMVGVDKKNYLARVCSLARSRGCEVELCSVGDMMYAEAPDIAPGRILDMPLKRLHGLRRSVFKDIIAKSRKCKNLIVNTHATFRWRHGLFPAADFDQIRQLRPDAYVCMLDSAEILHWRLTSEHPIGHTLKDLLVWREEEILGTEMLRRGVDDTRPFYLIARGAGQTTADSFCRLFFGKRQKKAYLSFPMTHVVGMPQVQAEIDRWRRIMKGIFICFDPGDLEEAYLPILAREATAKGRKNISMDAGGHKVKLNVREVMEVEKDIHSQIYTRDFMLIDQSDMIISFIPALGDGRAAMSSGVERELQHAHEAAKEVYVIWTAAKAPSVFVTQTATRVFQSVQEAVTFFRK
ncbi:MAG TPA: AAA family ATPase [Sedimentisphaerales bacterium]|nr:AAA family ATPase [Sedimentisphaerales bacterium]